MTIDESPKGPLLYRKVIVGRRELGPQGLPLCLQCGVEECRSAGALCCSSGCYAGRRAARRTSARPPRPAWRSGAACDAMFRGKVREP